MMKTLLAILFCASASLLFSQDYSYSFKGNLTADKESSLVTKISSAEGVEYCKVRYKPDSEKGEIILTIEKKEIRSEDQEVFSPAAIKAILLEHQLEPIDFHSIK